MFTHFFGTEIKYALKQPMVWIFLGMVTLASFGATSSDSIQLGGSVGNVFKNSPHIITFTTLIVGIVFGLLFAAAFFNNAALRDHKNNFNEILFSSPISKAGYFFGRFFGALLLSTIPMLGVFLGILLGTLVAPAVGWEDPSRFGSFYFETFLNNYLLFILPNMFVAGALIFAIANRWKSTILSFVGALAIIIAYFTAGAFLSDIESETIGALTDIFGIRAYSTGVKYFTPIEKNTLSPGFSGLILMNRLIWMGFGILMLALSYFSFSFQAKNKKAKNGKEEDRKASAAFARPSITTVYGFSTSFQQFKSFFHTNFLSIVKGPVFIIMLIFSAILLLVRLFSGFDYYGLQSYPITYKIIDGIESSSEIFLIIILVFFSGELVWRDRDSKIHEVIDSTPHSSIVSLLAKALSLITITTLLQFFFVFCGVSYQLLNGYTRLELDVYFADFLLGSLPTFIVWSGIMILIQVLMHNKYIGYFVSILTIFIWDLIVVNIFDVQSNMLSLNGGPRLVYSDMNGFGPGLTSALWFNGYWMLIGLLCLMVAGVVWNRGAAANLLKRFSAARRNVSSSYRLVLGGTVVLWVLVASFVFYNTQVLNSYKTSDQREEIAVQYEKTYKKYENVPLPKIIDASYNVEIFPYQRDVLVKATFQLKNETAVPIDSIHFNTNPQWEPEISIPGAKTVLDDQELGYTIFELEQAMQPGATITMEVNSKYISKGFENGVGNTNVAENGTFFNNFAVIPSLGYSANSELSDKNTRRKHDLKPKMRMPELESNCNTSCMSNYLSNGRSDYIPVETVISTAYDQIAIAPGSLIKKWTENGRNYYHYKVDHPSQHFFSFISAKYEVATRQWNGIDMEVYYDKKHGVNVEIMLDAVERSLKYYTSNFGPYFHKQCRIIEFPRYSTFAQAFPGTMPYSESFGFVANLEDEEGNNVIDAVVSHEMAHQWWAHQVVGADMQGGTMLSESFAEYSSLMTMKGIAETPMQMREFLKYDHDRYLGGRSGEVDKELPLHKVENQTHIHYGKGSVVLYALQDYIGEDKVNNAMRSFLEEYRYQPPPYPTSLDFLRHLEPQVPDSLQYLVTDWIKEITLYDNRLKEATYEELNNGKYRVSMQVESYKIKADTIGNETKVPINDWVDVGVFADKDEKELLYEERVKFDQKDMQFTFIVDSKPAKAAIDPRRLLIDRVYSDNIKSVSEL